MSPRYPAMAVALAIVVPVLALLGCAPAAAPARPTPTAQEKLAQLPTLPAATAAPSATPAGIAVTDSLGRTVKLEKPPARIVSLSPANTEILFALGVGDRVVAVDEWSDYPPEAKGKSRLTGLRPNVEQLIDLDPDLVLYVGGMQDLVAQLEGKGVKVAVLAPRNLEEIYGNLEMVGKLTGTEEAARKLVAGMRQRAEAVVSKTKDAPRPRVFYEIDASDPSKPYTAGPGSFVDALITMAGGANVAANARAQWAQFSLEELIKADPEIVVLADALVPTNPQTPEMVARRNGWEKLTAVKKMAIYPIDTDIVSRPGPRIVDGLEALAAIIHPELFQ